MIDVEDYIVNKLGIKSAEDNVRLYGEKIKSGVSLEEVETYSPDNIDNSKFWEVISKFPLAVCGNQDPALTVAYAKHLNKMLLFDTGICDTVYMIRKQRPDVKSWNILEIGPGWGSFRDFLDCLPDADHIFYRGVDVYPHMEDVILFDGFTLPACKTKDGVDTALSLAVSVNVFQHLSNKQRIGFLQQIHSMLIERGLLMFTTCLTSPNTRRVICTETNQPYIYHFGIYSPIHTYEDIIKELSDNGYAICKYTYRFDGLTTFFCIKK